MKLVAILISALLFSSNSFAIRNGDTVIDGIGGWPTRPVGPIETNDGSKGEIVDVPKSKTEILVKSDQEKKKNPISKEFFKEAEKKLQQKSYRDFSLFLSPKLDHPDVTEWLSARTKENPIIMWNLAESHAVRGEVDEAMKWGYTAVIASRVDALICSTPQVRDFAPGVVAEIFPSIQRTSRANSHLATKAYVFAFETLKDIEKWKATPDWICMNDQIEKIGKKGMINEKDWKTIRHRGLINLKAALIPEKKVAE